MKKCSKCKDVKSADDFYVDKSKKDGLQSNCKSCIKEISSARYNGNRLSIIERQKNYQVKNRDYVLEYKKTYYQKNKDILRDKKKQYREANKDRIHDQKSKFYEVNRDEILERRRKYKKERREKDPMFKVICSMRTRLSLFCKNAKLDKSFKTIDSVGLSMPEFKQYIESLFSNGMNWDNYGKGNGKWSIDHIKPLCTATTIDELFALNHYSNLQPMWSQDNSAKGGKYKQQ